MKKSMVILIIIVFTLLLPILVYAYIYNYYVTVYPTPDKVYHIVYYGYVEQTEAGPSFYVKSFLNDTVADGVDYTSSYLDSPPFSAFKEFQFIVYSMNSKSIPIKLEFYCPSTINVDTDLNDTSITSYGKGDYILIYNHYNTSRTDYWGPKIKYFIDPLTNVELYGNFMIEVDNYNFTSDISTKIFENSFIYVKLVYTLGSNTYHYEIYDKSDDSLIVKMDSDQLLVEFKIKYVGTQLYWSYIDINKYRISINDYDPLTDGNQFMPFTFYTINNLVYKLYTPIVDTDPENLPVYYLNQGYKNIDLNYYYYDDDNTILVEKQAAEWYYNPSTDTAYFKLEEDNTTLANITLYSHYREITINKNDEAEYPNGTLVKISIDFGNDFYPSKHDPDEIIFRDQNGDPLNYTIDTWDTSLEKAEFTVYIPYLATGTGTFHLYMYYDTGENWTVYQHIDLGAIYIYDDFSNGLNTDLWTIDISPSESSSSITVDTANGWLVISKNNRNTYAHIQTSISNLPDNFVVEAKVYVDASSEVTYSVSSNVYFSNGEYIKMAFHTTDHVFHWGYEKGDSWSGFTGGSEQNQKWYILNMTLRDADILLEWIDADTGQAVYSTTATRGSSWIIGDNSLLIIGSGYNDPDMNYDLSPTTGIQKYYIDYVKVYSGSGVPELSDYTYSIGDEQKGDIIGYELWRPRRAGFVFPGNVVVDYLVIDGAQYYPLVVYDSENDNSTVYLPQDYTGFLDMGFTGFTVYWHLTNASNYGYSGSSGNSGSNVTIGSGSIDVGNTDSIVLELGRYVIVIGVVGVLVMLWGAAGAVASAVPVLYLGYSGFAPVWLAWAIVLGGILFLVWKIVRGGGF